VLVLLALRVGVIADMTTVVVAVKDAFALFGLLALG
jgi:hypothetical protein